MNLEAIESRLVAACLELRPQYPAAFEGYYDRLLEDKRILTDADRAIAGYIAMRFPMNTPIAEFCPGIGQLSHALGLLGYAPCAIEEDCFRFEVSFCLRRKLASFIRLEPGLWQNSSARSDGQVWIITNAVSSDNGPEDLCYLRSNLDRGGHLVWQPSLFGVEGVEPLPGYNSVDLGHGVYHQWK